MDLDKNASSSEETISLSGSSDSNEEENDKVESMPENGTKEKETADRKISATDILPKNCPEQVIFVLDVNFQMTLPVTEDDSLRKSYLDMVKDALQMFITVKSTLNSKHQFAIVLLQKDVDSMFTFQEFTSDTSRLMQCVRDIDVIIDQEEEGHVIYLDDMHAKLVESFDIIQNYPINTVIPEHVTHIIYLHYGDGTVLDFKEEEKEHVQEMFCSSAVYFDMVFLNQSKGNETLKEKMTMLCNLDGKERSYICEASKNPAKIFECMAKLLAHPLQRCKQKDSFYSIVDTEM